MPSDFTKEYTLVLPLPPATLCEQLDQHFSFLGLGLDSADFTLMASENPTSFEQFLEQVDIRINAFYDEDDELEEVDQANIRTKLESVEWQAQADVLLVSFFTEHASMLCDFIGSTPMVLTDIIDTDSINGVCVKMSRAQD